MTLRLSTRLVNHPFPGDPGAECELWAEIKLSYEGPDGTTVLLEHQWDLVRFGEWLVAEGCGFRGIELPESPRQCESLAQALRRMNDRPDESFESEGEFDAWFERIYDFRRSHSIRFALRGAAIPEIIFGIRSGSAEISSVESGEWKYAFELSQMAADLIAVLDTMIESQVVSRWYPGLRDGLVRLRPKLAALRGPESFGITGGCSEHTE